MSIVSKKPAPPTIIPNGEARFGQNPDPDRSPVIRALVSMDALDVQHHAVLLAKVPQEQCVAAVEALSDHPMVLSCGAIVLEPEQLVIEIVGSAENSILSFTDWARARLQVTVHEFLPIEGVAHGGPDKIPSLEFLLDKPVGNLAPTGSRPSKRNKNQSEASTWMT